MDLIGDAYFSFGGGVVLHLIIWFFVGLAVSAVYLKKVNNLYDEATKAKDTFRQYHKLLDKIETAKFTSAILKEKQQAIQRDTQKASQIFSQFSKMDGKILFKVWEFLEHLLPC